MNPCIVVPVAKPSAHKMRSITASVYNIKFFLVGLPAGAKRASRQSVNGLHGGYRCSDSHIVDHARHAVDVGGEFGDETFFGGVGGNAAHGNDAVRR